MSPSVITTANVTVTRDSTSGTAGTNWTVDTTNCNLDVDTAIKDFLVYFNGVLQPNSSFTKNSSTLITYTGTALVLTTSVEVHRFTPVTTRVSTPTFRSQVQSTDYNNELNKLYALLNDITLNGSGAGGLITYAGQTFTGVTTFNGGSQTFSNTAATTWNVGTSTTFNNTPTFTGGASFGTSTISGGLTMSGNVVFSNAPTLTTKPNQITGSGTELVNADWVRQAIRPSVVVTQGTGQVLTAATWTTITLATEVTDTDNTFSGNTFTVPTGGGGVYLYEIQIDITVLAQAMTIAPRINGAADVFLSTCATATDLQHAAQLCGTLALAAGDVVVMRGWQNNTTAATRTVASAYFKIYKLGETS